MLDFVLQSIDNVLLEDSLRCDFLLQPKVNYSQLKTICTALRNLGSRSRSSLDPIELRKLLHLTIFSLLAVGWWWGYSNGWRVLMRACKAFQPISPYCEDTCGNKTSTAPYFLCMIVAQNLRKERSGDYDSNIFRGNCQIMKSTVFQFYSHPTSKHFSQLV
jgi:hypothetical protein